MLAMGVGSAQATMYNPVTGFSNTTNVATNTWSYWYSNSTAVSTYPGSIALNPDFFSDCGYGTQCWDQTLVLNDLILNNVTGSTAPFPNGAALNNQLTFYTRSGLELVRFTAPAAGSYDVTGFFEGSAANSETSQEFIAVNSNTASPLLDITAAEPLGQINPFSFMTALAAGGTIDFLVAGVSTTPDLNSLATGFDATITSGIPEPSTWATLLLGFAGLGFVGYRRTKEAARAVAAV